ncbi:hypothetical protein G809_00692 [Escherichia coli HVH 151 (4-5755573)]|nr:hypothetical protein G809_00692 [Escherichia coli HVH 151 (4-5755573)]
MFGNDICTRVKRSENKKMAEIAQFLHENDLSVDTTVGNDSNLLIVFYVQIMPDDLVMQLHRF